ncbi:hypothetical protein ABZW18_31300 [Streptomyces sp. NPDC004647]|uniref:hypothetical protein n=1 Tax=Streptomyces sp. NPDC004647 TaxID=3154671 RepID=UPI0033BD0567
MPGATRKARTSGPSSATPSATWTPPSSYRAWYDGSVSADEDGPLAHAIAVPTDPDLY